APQDLQVLQPRPVELLVRPLRVAGVGDDGEQADQPLRVEDDHVGVDREVEGEVAPDPKAPGLQEPGEQPPAVALDGMAGMLALRLGEDHSISPKTPASNSGTCTGSGTSRYAAESSACPLPSTSSSRSKPSRSAGALRIASFRSRSFPG